MRRIATASLFLCLQAVQMDAMDIADLLNHEQDPYETCSEDKNPALLSLLWQNDDGKKRKSSNVDDFKLSTKKVGLEEFLPEANESENRLSPPTKPNTLKCPYCEAIRRGTLSLVNLQVHCRKEHPEEVRTFEQIRTYNNLENDNDGILPKLKCPYCKAIRRGKYSLKSLQAPCKDKHPEEVRTLVFLQTYNDQK